MTGVRILYILIRGEEKVTHLDDNVTMSYPTVIIISYPHPRWVRSPNPNRLSISVCLPVHS